MKKEDERNLKFNKLNQKIFNTDLDRELEAAERFLNRKNDEVIIKKNENSDIKIIQYYDQNQVNNISSNQMIIENNKLNKCLQRYQKQLKSHGFPEIGNFYFLEDNKEDIEKTFLFFDHLIMKKSSENEEKMKFKKEINNMKAKISSLESENDRLQKEILSINEDSKKENREKKEFESKINKSKEGLEKQLTDLKSLNTKLNNKYNYLLAERKGIEEKYNKLYENYQKIINKNTYKASNHIELVDNLKKNDILKLLSKVRGTEKLIETFKNGFNESLRELLFEVSALKNFIFEANQDLIKKIDPNGENNKLILIDYNLLNMPFLDTVNKIKLVFNNNLKQINQCMSTKDFSINFDDPKSNSNKFLNELETTYDKKELELNETETNRQRGSLKSDGKVQSDFSQKNLIFDVEESHIETNNRSQNIQSYEDNLENELEYLKNKWVKTLMNLNKNSDNNENYEKDF
jgi:hypothetical protein